MKTALQQLPFWPRLAPGEQAALERSCRLVDYEAGQAVRTAGMDCLGVLLVNSGVLRVYLSSQEGREATIYRLHPGDVCVLTAACLMPDIDFDVQIDAQEASQVLLVPSAVFSPLAQSNVYVEAFLYRTATQRFSAVLQAVERMLFLTLEQRVASFLLDEGARQGGDVVRLTQEQLAQAIGSAREAVSRALKKMEKAGWVEVCRGGVRLADRPALYRLLAGA